MSLPRHVQTNVFGLNAEKPSYPCCSRKVQYWIKPGPGLKIQTKRGSTSQYPTIMLLPFIPQNVQGKQSKPWMPVRQHQSRRRTVTGHKIQKQTQLQIHLPVQIQIQIQRKLWWKRWHLETNFGFWQIWLGDISDIGSWKGEDDIYLQHLGDRDWALSCHTRHTRWCRT